MKIHKAILGAAGCLLLINPLTGCTPSTSIAAVLLIDKSASALDDKQFTEIASEGCHSVANNLLPTDYAGQITVNGSVPRASDLSQVLDPRPYHRDCQQSRNAALVNTAPKGTFSCPAWDLAFDLTQKKPADTLPVLYLSFIQTNESEDSCPDVWKKLAMDAEKRGGKLVIVGSSFGDTANSALDSGFNHLLWTHLKDSPSTVFCKETDVQHCIAQAFIDIRTPTGGKAE
jgi:hypothetical protein